MAAVVLLGTLAYAAYLFGPAIVRYTSDEGELVIEIDDPGVAVIDQTGATIHDKATGREYRVQPGRRDLKAGDYEIEVTEVGGDMRLFTKEFTIMRGGATPVRVTLAAKPCPRPGPAKAAVLYAIPWLGAAAFPRPHYADGIFSGRPTLFRGRRLRPLGRRSGMERGHRQTNPGIRPWRRCWYSSAQFLPGGKYLVTSYSSDNDLYLWHIATGEIVRKFTGHAQPPRFDLSPDGKRMLSWDDARTVRLWDVESGKELRKLQGHSDKAAGVFSPDGKQVLTSSPDKTLRLWDVESGQELKRLEGHTGACSGCFSPDGKQALSYGADHTIRLWDLGTGKEVRRFQGPTDKVFFAGFAADGSLVVGKSDDGKLRVWETAGGKLVSEINYARFGPNGWTITASPDGRLALVNADGVSVRVLDLAAGQEIHRYNGCREAKAFSFSPDGTLAVAGSFRAGMFVFRLPSDKAGGAGQESGK